jgi:hypothetical protein
MGDKRLYSITIPQDTLVNTEQRVKRNISAFGNLGGGPSVAESVSVEPQDRVLAGHLRAQRSKMLSDMVEQLFDAPNYEFAPYYDKDEPSQEDGFYALRNTNIAPIEPKTDGVQKFDGILKKKGTRETHFLSIKIRPAQVTHDFGTNSTENVGVPSVATKVRWLNTDGTIENPTVQSTVNAEFGDVDIYDANEASSNEPTLVYDMPYDQIGRVDPKVWDTRTTAGRVDTNGNLRWQKAFVPGHQFSGEKIISNGLLRLTFDEAANTLSAEYWDDGGGGWTSDSLNSSDWQLFECDIFYIGQNRVEAQVTFENTTNDNLYPLNVSVPRGYTDALWFKPEGETDSIPSGLTTKLTPIAHQSFNDPQGKQNITKKDEVRK